MVFINYNVSTDMPQSGLDSRQESQIFKKFGYGVARLFAGYKLRNMINNSEVKEVKVRDNVHEWRHINDPDFVEVAFNGDCKRVHYVNIGKNYHIGVIHDKESNKVEIVPKTLYKKEENGSVKMIDLKKTGFWPFRKSALAYDCGGDLIEAKEILNSYKNTKLLVHSDPFLTDKEMNNPKKCAAAMVNGRTHGKTSLAKVPNSFLNLTFFYFFPTLYFLTGHRESLSVTNSLRRKLSDAHVQEDREGFVKAEVLKKDLEDAQRKIKEMEAEKAKHEAEALKQQVKELQEAQAKKTDEIKTTNNEVSKVVVEPKKNSVVENKIETGSSVISPIVAPLQDNQQQNGPSASA